MLNDNDISLLQKPFELHEHGFRDGQTVDEGKPYILRAALINRLNSIDRGWKMKVHLETLTIVGDVATISGTLTIKGVEQTNISTGIIQRVKADGAEVKPFVLAQNMERAIKTAASGCLQRCLQWYDCGTYLKTQAFKGIGTRSALKAALDKLNNPPHWAYNGGGERIDSKRKTLNLEWSEIFAKLEPDKVLTGLTQTSLTEEQVSVRLDDIALDKLDKPAPRNEDMPIEVLGGDLQVNDLVYLPDERQPRRVMCILGAPQNTGHTALIELIVWYNVSGIINVKRVCYERETTYTVKRYSTLKPTPPDVQRQVDQLIKSHAESMRAPQDATT